MLHRDAHELRVLERGRDGGARSLGPAGVRFDGAIAGDFSGFFKAFDAMHAEEGGKFYLRAKPKVSELRRMIKQVDAEGVLTNWTFRAELTDRTVFSVEFREAR